MEKEKIINLENKIQKKYGNITGIVVMKHGIKHYESYFNGMSASHSVHIASVTKSVISILIGIAIDKGYIQSVDQKVLEFFPDYQVKQGEKVIQTITIQHLLTMSAPFKYRFAPYKKFYASGDWVTASLDLLGGKKATGMFRYMELIGPDILSGILTRTTKQSVLEFARANLFTPLGIEVADNILLKDEKVHVDFIKKNHGMSGWVADEKGCNTSGWGLTLTTMDMAKIGQLYLQDGKWEEFQIVSSAWVKESTIEHSRWEKMKLSYGYLWWSENDHNYAAMGNSGNIIYVDTKQQQVIAITALFKPRAKDIIALIQKDILPIL